MIRHEIQASVYTKHFPVWEIELPFRLCVGDEIHMEFLENEGSLLSEEEIPDGYYNFIWAYMKNKADCLLVERIWINHLGDLNIELATNLGEILHRPLKELKLISEESLNYLTDFAQTKGLPFTEEYCKNWFTIHDIGGSIRRKEFSKHKGVKDKHLNEIQEVLKKYSLSFLGD